MLFKTENSESSVDAPTTRRGSGKLQRRRCSLGGVPRLLSSRTLRLQELHISRAAHQEMYGQAIEHFAYSLCIRLVETRSPQSFRTLRTSDEENYKRLISTAASATHTGTGYEVKGHYCRELRSPRYLGATVPTSRSSDNC